jgi:hypothetical protein
MSTRCQIGVYKDEKPKLGEFEALLYRHSDGYPSGVLPDVMPFLAWWAKGRGIDDTEYVSARLLQYLCNAYDKQGLAINASLKKSPLSSARLDEEDEETKKWTGTLGHGICKHFHWDIEYFYAICPNGVHVYETGAIDKDSDVTDKSKLLGIVPYESWEKNAVYKKLIKNE